MKRIFIVLLLIIFSSSFSLADNNKKITVKEIEDLRIVELKKAGKINSLEEIIKFLNSNDDISRSMAQKLVWKVSYEMGNGEGKNKGLARKAIESWAKNKDRKVYEFASSDLEYYDKKEFERTYKIGKKLWEYLSFSIQKCVNYELKRFVSF